MSIAPERTGHSNGKPGEQKAHLREDSGNDTCTTDSRFLPVVPPWIPQTENKSASWLVSPAFSSDSRVGGAQLGCTCGTMCCISLRALCELFKGDKGGITAQDFST